MVVERAVSKRYVYIVVHGMNVFYQINTVSTGQFVMRRIMC